MIEGPPPHARDMLAAYKPIGLAELEATAALQTRVDRKYIVDWDAFVAVAGALRPTHRVLEIDGRRTFAYDTVYFDSRSLGAYRAHMQQRRRRYKARARSYLDSDRTVFEIKLKGRRGETIKHQLPYEPENRGRLTDRAQTFLRAHLAAAYPGLGTPHLSPTVRTHYQRLTLAHDVERVTCDFALEFADERGAIPGLHPNYVILESKCRRGLSAVDRQLRALGARPISCSKYCVGIGLLRDDVKVNDLRWLLERYFQPAAPQPMPVTP